MNPNDRDNPIYQAGWREGQEYAALLSGIEDKECHWLAWGGCAGNLTHTEAFFLDVGPYEGEGWLAGRLEALRWWEGFPSRYAARRHYCQAAADACQEYARALEEFPPDDGSRRFVCSVCRVNEVDPYNGEDTCLDCLEDM